MLRCLMFPGVDAIESPLHRRALLDFPEVRARLEQAQAVLDRQGSPSHLLQFMEGPNQATREWFTQLTLSTPPVHQALYERYCEEHGVPNLVLSCSLGDISRNLCLGLIDLETALTGLQLFTDHALRARNGAVYRVTSPSGFSEPEIREWADQSVWVSIYQNPGQLLVGGRRGDLLRWAESLPRTRPGRRVQPLYPFALHTPLMAESAEVLRDHVRGASVRLPSVKSYSAVSEKWLDSADEFRDEVFLNIQRPVRWSQSIAYLGRTYPEMRFDSLGPTATLVRFFARITGETARVTDFFESLSAPSSLAAVPDKLRQELCVSEN